MKGTYTIPAIPPHCAAIALEVEVVEWRGHRVLLREVARPEMLIDTELGNVELLLSETSLPGGAGSAGMRGPCPPQDRAGRVSD